jgi:SsrA-binding protein
MILVRNKKAYHDYTLTEQFTAGIVLQGQEVKSLRQGHGSLVGSHVVILGNEAFLLNAQITPYSFAKTESYDPKRTRKLLLHKREIAKLSEALQEKGWTIVPLTFELQHNHLKLTIAIARGKKQFEKRAVLKARAIERDTRREFKDKVNLR